MEQLLVRWVLSFDKNIVVDTNQIKARTEYIRSVTGASVSDWQYIQLNRRDDEKFLFCASNDAIDGVFITAHIGSVFSLCALRQICESKIIIANTCIWENLADKELLYKIRRSNPAVELYFAKQEFSIDTTRTFRWSTTLRYVGQFGFQTSLSERKLFSNRRKGFIAALKESFERVSPIILIGE